MSILARLLGIIRLRFMWKKTVILSTFVVMSAAVVFAGEVSLPSAKFNFQVNTISSDSTYKPFLAFVDNEKTYIRFPPTVTNDNMPIILVDQLGDANTPIILWQQGYVVINQPSSHIKIYNPKTKKLIYDLTFPEQFNYAVVPPSPRILPYEYAGFFVGATVGASNIDGKGISAAGGMKAGYDWHFLKGFLAGFEFGFNYDGKVSKDSVNYKSWNINTMLRAKYLFQSGFSVTGKAGIAYVKNSQSTPAGAASNSIRNTVAPRFGAEVGYLFTNGIGLNLEYDHLFSSSKVLSLNSFRFGVSYIF
ncbi:outer membrane protein [Fastidiosibacter lacustris]|uniref:outer membrane protein n=1 Tax=Fastidiosibacter lacustris TaxID=2056695 RepID=UPI000E354454|nr:porin family protein [Fastidiosibacter lacustris]